jgi:hypothetical protein
MGRCRYAEYEAAAYLWAVERNIPAIEFYLEDYLAEPDRVTRRIQAFMGYRVHFHQICSISFFSFARKLYQIVVLSPRGKSSGLASSPRGVASPKSNKK